MNQVTQDIETLNTSKNRSRSFFWPLFLIILGLLFLLNNLGILPWGIWDSLIRFWPILLILTGLEILLGRSRSSNLIITIIGLLILGFVLYSTIPDLTTLVQQSVGQISNHLRQLFNH